MNIDWPLKTRKNLLCRFFLLLILTGCVLNARSQEQDTIIPIDKDPEEILKNVSPRNIIQGGFNFWQDNFSGHWAGIDVGFNTFLNKDYSGYNTEFMENDFLLSNSLYVNIIQQSIGLQKNRNTIGLITGLGMHFQSYRLNRNTTIHRTESGRIEPRFLLFDQNQKSKFSIVSVMIPLLAEFQIPINHYRNRFFVSTGPYMAIRLSSHTKIKYRSDRKEKLKVPGHYSMHNFKYGIMLRTGYRYVQFFATYDFVPLFFEDKGPELFPFTVGITLLSF